MRKQDDLPPSCGEVRDQLGPRLDGELSPRETAAVEAHLVECGPCRDVDADLRRDWLLLAALPDPIRAQRDAQGDEFLAAVRARVRRPQPASRSLRGRLMRWVSVSAAAAALALCCLLFLSQGRVAGDPDFLEDVAILVDLREEAGDLEPELIGLLLDELDPGAEPETAGDEALFEIFLEEELEGARS